MNNQFELKEKGKQTKKIIMNEQVKMMCINCQWS